MKTTPLLITLFSLGTGVFSQELQAAPVFLSSGESVSIAFEFSAPPATGVDYITLGLAATGSNSGPYLSSKVELYNGSSLLGTYNGNFSNLNYVGQFTSPDSYAAQYLPNINFSTIQSGTIDGRMVLTNTSTSGTVQFDSSNVEVTVREFVTKYVTSMDENKQPTVTSVVELSPPPPPAFSQNIKPCILAGWCADQYSLDFDGNELTLSMTIGINGSPSADLIATWEKGIEQYWGGSLYGNRYSIKDGTNMYPIYFDVDFVESSLESDFIVNVIDGIGPTTTNKWYTTVEYWGNEFQDEAAAHEFGHFLGLYDEYKGGTLEPPLGIFGLGWRCDTSKSLSDPVNADCDGLMGDLRRPTVERYYKSILDNFGNLTGRDVVLAGLPIPPPPQSFSDYIGPFGEGPLGPSGSSAVPEPSTQILLLLGLSILLLTSGHALRRSKDSMQLM